MNDYYIGLMSGTSLDAVDAILMDFSPDGKNNLVAHVDITYPEEIRQAILALQDSIENELHQAATLANVLAELYAEAVDKLLQTTKILPTQIKAIGCHGQTVRHAPEHHYTIQLGNLALLAEKTKIDVIGDFRSRDIAAKGQGAPLVPAFHQHYFGSGSENRVVLNIGGIANISVLPASQEISGFDTGPGNMLMDAWTQKNWQKNYDNMGQFAAQGYVLPNLLAKLCADPYFTLPAPKSTGRDHFNLNWLSQFLSGEESPYDVQATLLELTAKTIAQAITLYAPQTEKLIICGGGVNNQTLLTQLKNLLPNIVQLNVEDFGIKSQCVEAAAFAWLAKQFNERQPTNIPRVTGAVGLRVLGALYPA